MDIFTLFILAVGLSMDACAAAVCKGLAMRKLTAWNMTAVAFWFGAFQALMPAAGYMLGVHFQEGIRAVDHWMAFFMLGIIGGNMIRDACGRKDTECGLCGEAGGSLAFREMFPLALATSVDALAAGVTFAFLSVDIRKAVLLIGAVTFVCSLAGVKAGNVFGIRYKTKAECAGGIILVLLGVKILWEHIGCFFCTFW